MRDVHHPRAVFPLCLGLLGLLAAGCPTADDDDTTAEDPWVAEQADLPGAALSIWGTRSDDLWVVGTGGDVDEPMVLHRSGTTWDQLDTGQAGEAWWVVGDGEGALWVVGSAGLVLRTEDDGATFTKIATTTNATLFGAWVAPSGRLYTVGGVVFSSDEGPILLSVDGDVATEVTLPAGLSNNENLFKVWGSADDDIWVISDMGTVLHFNGTAWSSVVLPDNPRLVTVHGSGPTDVVIVGGLSRTTIFQRDGMAWDDVSPPGGQPLNGVFVKADGAGFAAGFGNFMMQRTSGTWTSTDGPMTINSDWHGAWIDEAGAPWVVGGDLTVLTDGVVARRETP